MKEKKRQNGEQLLMDASAITYYYLQEVNVRAPVNLTKLPHMKPDIVTQSSGNINLAEHFWQSWEDGLRDKMKKKSVVGFLLTSEIYIPSHKTAHTCLYRML